MFGRKGRARNDTFKEARRLYEAGSYNEAIEILGKAAICNPDDPAIPYMAGKAHMRLGETNEAHSCFEDAGRINQSYLIDAISKSDDMEDVILRIMTPGTGPMGAADKSLIYDAAQKLDAEGEHEKAPEAYDALINVDPNDHSTHNARGSALAMLGRHD